jgi:exonuclease SbcC
MSKIISIHAENVKGQKIQEPLTGRDIWLGENGVGKSARLQAFIVGVQGNLPKPFKKSLESTFQIASGDSMVINLQTDGGFSFGRTVTRKVTQHKDDTTSYSYKSDCNVFPNKGEGTASAKEKRILDEIGSFAIMFDLDEFMSRSDSKKRELIFELSSPENYGWNEEKVKKELEEILEGEIPVMTAWDSNLSVAANVARALSETGKLLTEARAVKKSKDAAKHEIIQLRQKLMADATDGTDDIQEQLKGLRERKAEYDKDIATAEEVKKQHATLKERETHIQEVDAEVTRMIPPNIEEAEQAVEDAKSRVATDDILIQQSLDKIDKMGDELEKASNLLQNSKEEILREDKRQSIRDQINIIDKTGCPLMGEDCQSDLSEYRKKLDDEWGKINDKVKVLREKRDEHQREVNRIAGMITTEKGALKNHKSRLKKDKQAVRDEEKSLKSKRGDYDKIHGQRARLEAEYEAIESMRKSLSAIVDTAMAAMARTGVVEQISDLEAKEKKAQEVQNVMANFDSANIASAEADELVEELTKLQDALGAKGVQAKILKNVVGPLAKTVNGLLANVPAPEGDAYTVDFNLYDLNGKETFEIFWPSNAGNIHYNTLSGGQKVLFGAALMVALINQAAPPHRSMCIEAAELSSSNFYNLVEALDLIAGDIDNILIASCSDAVISDHASGSLDYEWKKNWNIVHLT